MKKDATIIALIIGIIVITVISQITIADLKERLSWCNTNSCYTNDATDNDLCHRLLAQEPTSTCQSYLDQCKRQFDELFELFNQSVENFDELAAMCK